MMKHTIRSTNPFSAPAPAPKRGYLALALLAGACVGAALLLDVGERAVFHYAEPYTTIALLAVVLLSPLVLYGLKYGRGAGELARTYPASRMRNAIVLPLTAAMVVGMVFAAPLGWLFAGLAWSDAPVERVDATAIEVGTYYRRKGCDQEATLRLASVDKETCLDGLFAPAAMRPGQHLAVGIKRASFGFVIVSISEAVPATAQQK